MDAVHQGDWDGAKGLYHLNAVAKLLNKLLVESKNRAVIRKHIGYGHIPIPHAERIDQFYRKYFNPYLNYHRPCGFATVSSTGEGSTNESTRQPTTARPTRS